MALPVQKKTGETAPRPRGHFPAAFTQQRLAQLDELTDKQPDATLEELVDLSNVECSVMAVKRALDRLGYRYKKTLYADEQNREDVKLQRKQWLLALPGLDPKHLVFIDESGAYGSEDWKDLDCIRYSSSLCV